MKNLTKLLSILTIGFFLIVTGRFLYAYLIYILLPFWFTIVGFFIYKDMKRHKKRVKVRPIAIEHFLPWFMIIGLALLYEGHGMNFAANLISHSLNGASSTLTNLVYLLDETVSHIIMFIGIFMLFFSGAILQISRPFSLRMSKVDEVVLGIFGIFFGLGMAGSLIEANIAIPGIIMNLLFLPVLLFRHRAHKLRIVIRKYPLNYYLGVTVIVTIITLVVYYLLFGGFTPLSEIICNMGYENACVYGII